MAIAVDNTTSADGSAGTTLTIPHTCTGIDLVLALFVASEDSTVTAAYDGDAMTQVAIYTDQFPRVFMFVLDDPNTGANNIVITKDSGIEVYGAGISFTGAESYDATAQNDGISTSATITTNTNRSNGYVVSGIGAVNPTSITYTGSGTNWGFQEYGNRDLEAAYTSFSGGGNVTDTWTLGVSNDWTMLGVEIYEKAPDFSPKTIIF